MLRRAGEHMADNAEHQRMLRAELQQRTVKGPSKAKKRIAWSTLGALTGALLLFAVVRIGFIQSSYVDDVYTGGGCPTCSGGGGDMALDSISADSLGLADSAGMGASESAFDIVRQWIPDPETRRQGFERYGNLLEERASIALLSNDKDTPETVFNLFSGLGGSVGNLEMDQQRGSLTLNGEIPTRSLPALRTQLEELVGEKYFNDNLSATSQLNAVLHVDERIETIQEQIDTLTAQIEREDDEDARNQLIAQRNARETEKAAQENEKLRVVNETHLADVHITVQHVRPWWQTTSRYELEKSVTGFEQPSFGQSFWINVLFILRGLITFFSYTFWILIPLTVWWVWRKARWERLERYL